MLKSTIAVFASALGNDPRAVPTIARTLGFDGLQFDIFSPSLNLADLSATGRREFLHLLSAQNQQLVSLRARRSASRDWAPAPTSIAFSRNLAALWKQPNT